MAGRAKTVTTKRKGPRVRADLERSPYDPRGISPKAAPEISDERVSPQQVKLAAARLYAMGYKRKEIVRMLVDHLITDAMRERPMEQKLASARGRLRSWEKQEKFRDLVWEQGLIKLDLQSGQIMDGIARKAKKGRVDAARLVFELTGRHNPKGEAQPTQIALVVNGIPRPMRTAADGQAVVADLEAGED